MFQTTQQNAFRDWHGCVLVCRKKHRNANWCARISGLSSIMGMSADEGGPRNFSHPFGESALVLRGGGVLT